MLGWDKFTKIAWLLWVTFTSSTALATTVQIHKLCDDGWLVSKELQSAGLSAGELTIHVLEDSQVPFIGTPAGIVSVDLSPHGDAALEVISDERMRAYGWCYEVDGVQPSQMPDELILSGQERQITWFYAYSSYDRGEWLDYCVPVYSVHPNYICGTR